MYQAKSGVKSFSLYWGGVPRQKIFCQSEHVSSQIWCQKFFPLLGGGGVPQQKFFSSVWTCIKPNLVSKIFPFTGGGGVPWEKFFPQSEHVSSQIWCQKFFLLLGGGALNKKFVFWSEHVSSQIWCQNFFPLLRLGTPPPPELDLGTPPPSWVWSDKLKTVPSPILRMRAVKILEQWDKMCGVWNIQKLNYYSYIWRGLKWNPQ